MMKITVEEKELPEVGDFAGKEWDIADLKHYGKEVDWTTHARFIQAYEGDDLVGALELEYEAGVMHIEDLIVSHSHHRKGIGKALMKKAEEIAREAKLHKIFLETGEEWEAREFYEKLGYIKTGDLPKHSGGHDYVQYSKILKSILI